MQGAAAETGDVCWVMLDAFLPYQVSNPRRDTKIPKENKDSRKQGVREKGLEQKSIFIRHV